MREGARGAARRPKPPRRLPGEPIRASQPERERPSPGAGARRLLIGIDVGGTFTDAVAYDAESSALWTAKVRTTPQDQADGFTAALQAVLAAAGAKPKDIERIAHGTTLGTNAILEHRGATIGILTTEGFEDTLYIGRQKRTEMYDLFIGPETPGFLTPRRRVHGIPERVAPSGEVVKPLDEQAVRDAVRALPGIAAIAISFLFSYANPAHERRAAEIVREICPTMPISLSHQIDARFREYERLCVTAFDAYVRPSMERYLTQLGARLRDLGVTPPLQVMQSGGGVTGVETVLERTVGTVLSGLAAGVLGGRFAAERAGIRDVITIDVGGTSADVALIRDGKPLIAAEGRVGGYPLRIPMVDVETVGAGGGSIASVAAGGLRVGPRSAGAEPGPAAYGRGGVEPTVTDASLVLGYFGEGGLAGGQLSLDLALATRAVSERVAAPLGVSLEAAAAGIHRVINAVMTDALRLASVKRGHDPRDLALVALGGAGPIHAGRLAADLGIQLVIVPAAPGVLSALGLLLAEVEHQEWASLRARLDSLDPARLAGTLARLDEACAARMARDGIQPSAVARTHVADLRYVGQSHELSVPLTGFSLTDLAAAFHETHQRHYGQSDPNGAVELVSVRVRHAAALTGPTRLAAASGTSAPPTTRDVYFEELGQRVPTPVWQRGSLTVGQRLEGPAIVEQADTTTVVYPGQRLRVDPEGSLLIEL